MLPNRHEKREEEESDVTRQVFARLIQNVTRLIDVIKDLKTQTTTEETRLLGERNSSEVERSTAFVTA